MHLQFDAVVVGGASAGLSAALALGRSRRRVLVCDGRAPRNATSPALHGFLTRDGVAPRELYRLADQQLGAYPTVSLVDAMVTGIVQEGSHFEVHLQPGGTVRARRVLLATGVVDELPHVAGLRELWGTKVVSCPYGDGWELRDARICAYVRGPDAREMGITLTGWTPTVTLFTDGHSVSVAEHEWFVARGITLRTEPVLGLEADGDRLVVRTEGGGDGRFAAMFVTTVPRPRARLAERLACALDSQGFIRVNARGETTQAGVFAAGDVVSGALPLTIVSAASGAVAAIGLNRSLLEEDARRSDGHAVSPVKREVATRPLAVRQSGNQ